MSLTQKWLRENTLFYPNNSRIYADVDAALQRYSLIRPKTDVYTYDDGRTQLLLCLHGLLSISYRQASYNIPIAIWLTRDYPREPPITYVVATGDMLIRAGQFVEISGRCNIEYIQNWHRKSEGCNILALLESMQSHFSKEPPVYAKPKDLPPPQHPLLHNDYSAKPPPPIPQTPSRSPSQSTPRQSPPPLQSTPLQTNNNDRPPLPPKPISSDPNLVVPYSMNYTSPPQTLVSPVTTNLASISPLPRLGQYQHSPPQSPLTDPTSGFAPLNPSGNAPSSSVRRWSIPPTDPNISQVYPQQPVSPPSRIYRSPPPPPPPPPTQVPHTLPSSPPPRNLLDEDGEPGLLPPAPEQAPPRPPNPELLRLYAQIHSKLDSEFGSLSQAMSLDGERLRAHQNDLLTGEPAIRDEMARLEAVRDVCNNVSGRLRSVVDQGERNVADLKQKGDPEVDEMVCSTTIVHNQLINLIAEDNAIEDTIYHLHRALNTGRIDLERFIRTTRVLAEEQFMKRALIEKIQVGVPMGSWS